MNNATTNGYCYKCSGSGRLPKFSHIDGGVCFVCRGTGKKVYRADNAATGAKGTERERLISYLGARIEEAKRAEDRAEWAALWSTEHDGYPRLLDTLNHCFRAGHKDVYERAILAFSKLGISPIDLGAT